MLRTTCILLHAGLEILSTFGEWTSSCLFDINGCEQYKKSGTSRNSPTASTVASLRTKMERRIAVSESTDIVLEPDSIASKMERLLMSTQAEVCQEFERLEGDKKFTVEEWRKENNTGGGIACVLQGGQVFDRTCVNVSVMQGNLSAGMEQHMRNRGKSFQRDDDGTLPFTVVNLGSYSHPVNPFCPPCHFHYRYFEVVDKTGEKTWWFGGGADLNPSYLDEEDVSHFHKTHKAVCDNHNGEYYSEFKRSCDEYHFIKIRGEHLGAGGIFFDDLRSEDPNEDFKFVTESTTAILPSYVPIVEKNMNKPFGEREIKWHRLRRGRHVEFALLYGRGMKFGVDSPNARVESMMAILPPQARWEYNHTCEPGSPEEEMLKVLKTPREWV